MSLDRLRAFIRNHTAPLPVPLAPEIRVQQASELTPLWHATAADLRDWDDSPFWAFPWAGGQALARYVLDHRELVRGRVVLDFATGSGLVGIAAALAGAARVVAADLDPFCEAAVSLNAELNGVSLVFRSGDPIGDPLPGVDVVLAGDVFYEQPLAERSLAWFRSLAASGITVLAGDPGRNYSPTAGFGVSARYDVPTTLEIEGRPVLPTRVLDIAPLAA
ncbi:MAG TPA: 50S ribosomal protein L11 methyltransferase [Anaeromyxobacteraceae bacterium]|nr:50S ribosomal protein L11 methyltransferase [Anaeromyxobacteraceae bacterium]